MKGKATKKEKTKEMIGRTVERIKKEYQPEKTILFGSYAWGEPDKHSDLDLFIIKETQERHIDQLRLPRSWMKGAGFLPSSLGYTHRVRFPKG